MFTLAGVKTCWCRRRWNWTNEAFYVVNVSVANIGKPCFQYKIKRQKLPNDPKHKSLVLQSSHQTNIFCTKIVDEIGNVSTSVAVCDTLSVLHSVRIYHSVIEFLQAFKCPKCCLISKKSFIHISNRTYYIHSSVLSRKSNHKSITALLALYASTPRTAVVLDSPTRGNELSVTRT